MEISEMTGRKKELETLEAFVKENRARLIIVQGKKRAGKTFLINSFFREKYTFSLTGTDNTTKSMNLKNFAIELADRAGKRINTPTNWIRAFSELKMYLTGQGAFLYTKLLVNDMIDQKGLISSDMLSDKQVEQYIRWAEELGITYTIEVKEGVLPVDLKG